MTLQFRCLKHLLIACSKSDILHYAIFYRKLSLTLTASIYFEANVKGRHLHDCSELLMEAAQKYILINAQIRNLGTIIFFHPHAVTLE